MDKLDHFTLPNLTLPSLYCSSFSLPELLDSKFRGPTQDNEDVILMSWVSSILLFEIGCIVL